MLDELASKTEDLAAYITGGKSCCYLAGGPGKGEVVGLVVLVHHGKHPLYDVSVRVVDLEAFRDAQATDKDQLSNMLGRSFRVGDQIAGHSIDVPASVLGDFRGHTERNFNIFFTARNGSFMQALRYRKINGAWEQATQVTYGAEIRYESISKNYPREPDGSVKWH